MLKTSRSTLGKINDKLARLHRRWLKMLRFVAGTTERPVSSLKFHHTRTTRLMYCSVPQEPKGGGHVGGAPEEGRGWQRERHRVEEHGASQEAALDQL